ncbi:MAG: isocitrate lyase/phosphoenolpyruvate mutase family protein [Hyphomonadaceae bacterium]|nr:isocitrate lyase/phosphoenolpyruvate mutase family protein [Hyphomonadaceae bacterium]GIK49219.1 MAG: hypothetical protein BroJett013_19160 [Alphaproteobacteria bacterium]
MTAQSAQAAQFHALHTHFLILPNAWDAVSARAVRDAGAQAVATSSAAVAWVHGYADGHRLPIAKLVAAVEELARAPSASISKTERSRTSCICARSRRRAKPPCAPASTCSSTRGRMSI